MPPKTTIRPYQLVATNGPLSRSDLSTWEYNQLSFCRQNETWADFLPGGNRSTWVCKDEDETYGLVVLKADGVNPDPAPTQKLRGSFKDLLNCISLHCPNTFADTVQREATSWSWIINLIKDTYDLNTKGEQFLGGNDIKLEFDETFTYQQGFMLLKDYYISCLPARNTMFKGKALTADDKLSPLAELFIVEKWLLKIDPRLPGHAQRTRGHLFSEAKPTLVCNQRILCDQIKTMLSELDGAGNSSSANVNVGYVPNRRPGFGGARQPFNRGRGLGGFRGQGRPAPDHRQVRPPMAPFSCQHCLEARRYDASITHPTGRCQWMMRRAQPQSQPQLRQPVPGFKVLLVPNQPATPTQPQHNPGAEQNQQAVISQLQSMSYEDQYQYPDYSQAYQHEQASQNEPAYQYEVPEDQYTGAAGYTPSGFGYAPATLEEL